VLIGRVSRTVVPPTKHPGLIGTKILMIEFDDGRAPVLATDTVGAGVGSLVVVAQGSHAVAVAAPQVPTDTVIVGLLE
jgi:microcompartment protein CcmK/EutM